MQEMVLMAVLGHTAVLGRRLKSESLTIIIIFMSSSRKRKYRPTYSTVHDNEFSSTPQIDPHVAGPSPMLFIQAHEADIVRTSNSRIAARSLEVSITNMGESMAVGEGLIRWGSSRITAPARSGAVIDTTSFDGQDVDDGRTQDDELEIWVDRYAFSEKFQSMFLRFDTPWLYAIITWVQIHDRERCFFRAEYKTPR